MIIVAICDEDTSIRILLQEFIQRYREETGYMIQILSYDSGEKLLHHYPMAMDLIFLEIPFRTINGLEIARRIREIDSKVSIVFLTTLLHHVFEAYSVRANNYMLKPLLYQKFLYEVEEARKKKNHHRYFLESSSTEIHKVYTNSILYIETDGKYTKIHTETHSISSQKRMKTHEEILYEPYFVRCHQAYIVNLLHFLRMDKEGLILQSGHRIPISRSHKSTVIKQIQSMYEKEYPL